MIPRMDGNEWDTLAHSDGVFVFRQEGLGVLGGRLSSLEGVCWKILSAFPLCPWDFSFWLPKVEREMMRKLCGTHLVRLEATLWVEGDERWMHVTHFLFLCALGFSWVLVWIFKIPLHRVHGVLGFVACIMSEAWHTTENHKNNSNNQFFGALS